VARLCLVSLVLALMILCAAAASPVHAQQWLADGGFETGGDAWLVSGGSSAACEPHQGSGALGVGVSGQGEGKLSHQLEGQLTATTYTLSGWTRIRSGAGTVKVVLGLVTPRSPSL
jgi:opacity protein-like surface antigen